MSSQKILQTCVSLSVFLILAAGTPLSGEEKAPPRKKAGKIQIHTFILKGESQETAYYAAILPKTLYRYLKATGTYAPVLKKGSAPAIDADKPDSTSNKKILGELANPKKNIHYICTGIIETSPDSGTIATIIIYNVKTDTIKILPASRLESGAVLGSSMDTLSDSMIKRFNFAVAEARRPVKKRRAAQTSPYLGFYRFLSRFDFGITTGYTFMVGDFSNYENGLEVRSHLGFDFSFLVPNLSVRWVGGYFSAPSGDTGTSYSLRLWNIGGSVCYSLPFHKHISLSGELGTGATIVNTIEDDGTGSPFPTIIGEMTHTRAYLFLGLGVDFKISSITLSAGTSYRRIFVEEKGIDMLSITGSFIYHL